MLAVIGIIYGALGCLAQTDMKRLIAFSSVAHMGFVMLGISTLTDARHQRRAVRHGRPRSDHRHVVLPRRLGEGALPHARDQPGSAACCKQMPQLGWILGFCAMASLGLPGLAGFWGEFPAILSAYSPAAGTQRAAVPDVDGRSPRIGTVLAAATCCGCSSAPRSASRPRSSAGHGTATRPRALGAAANDEHHDDIHDVNIFEWIAWTPLLDRHRRARCLPAVAVRDHGSRRRRSSLKVFRKST